MITEDYVSFETAKLLKEKGFDEKCRTYYKVFPKDRIAAIYHSSEDRGVSEDDPNEILCPTLQMAMKWLREEYRLFVNIEPLSGIKYTWSIWFMNESKEEESSLVYDTYEQACEAAIRYCLEYLI